MNKTFKKFVIICLLLIVASVGGIWATWKYATGPVDPITMPNNCEIVDIYYPENVPDDPDADLSHHTLLQRIISPEVGINNPNSLLSDAIEKRINVEEKNTVNSGQQVSGGNLKNTFGNILGYEYVGFLIVMTSDTVYDIYTYDNRDTQKVNRIISVFWTQAVKVDGTWVLRGGKEGTATTITYDGNISGKYKNTINPTSFKELES